MIPHFNSTFSVNWSIASLNYIREEGLSLYNCCLMNMRSFKPHVTTHSTKIMKTSYTIKCIQYPYISLKTVKNSKHISNR